MKKFLKQQKRPSDGLKAMGSRRHRTTWAEAASKDLEVIVAYIASDSPPAARRILERIQVRVSALALTPNCGRVVPELAKFGIRAFRELIVRPYRLICRLQGQRVTVLAVFDGRRDIEEVLLERLIRS